MLKNCLFGTYRAAATKNYCAPIGSEYPATIRIDKNEDRTCLSRRRSRVRVPSCEKLYLVTHVHAQWQGNLNLRRSGRKACDLPNTEAP